jgi:hypothetical protein
MINRYNRFLLNKFKQNINLILEGYLYGSSDFLLRLSQIKKIGGRVGEIANEILDLVENEDYEISDKSLKQNFFDVVDNEDKISFIQNSKVPEDWQEDNIDPYSMSGRNGMNIGRIIRYICKIGDITISDKDLEDFVNVYKSTTKTEIEFKLVSGSDIAKYYKGSKIFSDKGSLGSSCMLDASKSKMKIYTENPEEVSMLVYIDKFGKIHGRALVWKLEKSPIGSKYFMDRVYTNRDSDVNRFIEYAKEQGWLYKRRMSSNYDETVSFRYNGGILYGEISVKLDGSFRKYPFLDTLKFLNKDKNELSNLPSKKCFILDDWESGEKYRCYDCDGNLYEDYYDSMTLCDECCDGHRELSRVGIETDVYKKTK